MTNKEIFSIFEGLTNLRQDASMRLPARSMFALSQDFRILQPIVEDIQTTRTELLNKYGTPDKEQPTTFQIPPENRDILMKELDQLDAVENDVKLHKIKLADLEDVSLSFETMDSLFSIIEEES